MQLAKDELLKKVDEFLDGREAKTLTPMEFFAIAIEYGWRKKDD